VTLVLGTDELEKGQVALKNLVNGEQVSILREQLVDAIKNIIDSN